MVKEKNKFLKGAIILTITSIVAKVLGAFYRVPLVSMIGSKGIGIFQLIFPIYTFFLIFISGGTSLGISKLVSVEMQNNNKKNIKMILKSSLVLMLVLSVIFGILFVIISLPLSIFQGEKKLFVCYLALVPALIFSSLISALKGYYQGKQNMLPSGVSQIVEQVLKLVFSLLLSKFFIKKGVISAVFGVFLGISVSELGAFIYLFARILFEKKTKKCAKTNDVTREENSVLTFFGSIKLVIKTCMPIMLNGAIMPLVYAVESSLTIWLLSRASISNAVATSLFGLEDGIVGSLINLPTVISSSIAVATLPSITASWSSGDQQECEKKARTCLKFTWLIALPCAVAFLLLSKDLVLFLYNNGLSKTIFDELKVVVDLVKISSINIVYISMLNVVTSLLQGINKSYVPVRNLLVSGVIKLILAFVLVSTKQINIYGLVISDSVCFMLALILDLLELRKVLDYAFDFKNFVFKPIVCVLTMVATILLTKKLLGAVITARALTLITVVVAGIVYLINIFLTKTLKKEDLAGLAKRKLKQ